jgi:hypothetical protein
LLAGSLFGNWKKRAALLASEAAMQFKKPSIARAIGREAPGTTHVEAVDFDPTAPPSAAGGEMPACILEPAPVVDWRSSSYDLLNGLEVRDHSDSIPGALFERLFKT